MARALPDTIGYRARIYPEHTRSGAEITTIGTGTNQKPGPTELERAPVEPERTRTELELREKLHTAGVSVPNQIAHYPNFTKISRIENREYL
jgi:hypothetical protein